MVEFNFKVIEEKWQKCWMEVRVFELDRKVKFKEKKFYIMVVFLYFLGYFYVGYVRMYIIFDVIVCFKRMQGYNVLFLMGWYIIGVLIVGIVERIKNCDFKIIYIYCDVYKVFEEILWKFEDLKEIVKYFMKVVKEIFIRVGFFVDWMREFYIISFFLFFSKFIEWQFWMFKDMGLVVKGVYRVRWDFVVGIFFGDYDIMEGEDVQIFEYVIIKFIFEENGEIIYLLVVILRFEIVYGVINMWLNLEVIYVKVKVRKGDREEFWIVSKEVVYKFFFQDREIEVIEEFKGEKFIGKYVKNLVMGDEVIILLVEFVDFDNVMGVVMSVLVYVFFDYIVFEDLKKEIEILFKYDIDLCVVEEISYILLISLEGYGEFLVVEEVERFGVKSQKDKEKLEQVIKNIYKVEYYKGIFKIEFYVGKFV